MAKKKIKDLTLKEFYLFLTKQIERAKTLCLGLGRDPLDFLRGISIIQYIREKGDTEVEEEEYDKKES